MIDPLHITEMDIQALVDNQLEWEAAKKVLVYIDRTPWAQKYYERLIMQKKLLNEWWEIRKKS